MMKVSFYIIVCSLFILSCSKSDFSTPVLSPEFEAAVNFSNGDIFEQKAGESDYYMHTDGYYALGKKVYSSSMAIENECSENCPPSFTIELHQGNANESFLAFSDLNFLSSRDQVVSHELALVDNNNSPFSHTWNVEGESSNQLEALAFNQNLGNENELNVTLKYQSIDKGFVQFKQSFAPLKNDNFRIELELSKTENESILHFSGDGIKRVLWSNGQDSLIRTFSEDVREVVQVENENGRFIKVLIFLEKQHPSFAPTQMGYNYTNTVLPELNAEEFNEVEIIYEDEYGLKFRSSLVDQILPHSFVLNDVETYIDNESGLETYQCNLSFTGLLRNKKTNTTKYIKDGSAKFAFLRNF